MFLKLCPSLSINSKTSIFQRNDKLAVKQIGLGRVFIYIDITLIMFLYMSDKKLPFKHLELFLFKKKNKTNGIST